MATKHKRPKWPFPQHGKLTAHPRGHWCKWLDRGTRYFGRWRTPDPGDEFAKAALKRYLAYVQAKADQRPVQLEPSDLTLHIAINHYLTARDRDLAKGTLSPGQFVWYKQSGRILMDACGRDKLVRDMSPPDFEFLRTKFKGGPVRVGNRIQCVRSIFKWVLAISDSDHAGPAFCGFVKGTRNALGTVRYSIFGACIRNARNLIPWQN